MDTEIYSEAVIHRFLKKNFFFNDPVLERYYETDNIVAFRKRIVRVYKKESFEKIIYAFITDSVRDIIYKTVGELSEFLRPMGDLIISGGDAFNMYLERKDRIITSDIDTKFVPRIAYNDKYFGKLQAIKLLLWNKLGEIAKNINMQVKERVSKVAKTKLGRFIGLGFAEKGPYVTRRYILIKKKKTERSAEPAKGDVFIDVELFALDLNVRHFSCEQGKIIQEVLGGILDIPFMRPGEFGFDVIETKKQGIVFKNKNTGEMVQDKRVYVAGKRFLFEDVYLMQKLGLRPEKKEKDRQRMYKLSKMIVKNANIQVTDSIDKIYEYTRNKITPGRPKSVKRPIRVNISRAAKINPFSYKEYTSQPKIDRLARQFVYGIKTSVPNMVIPGYTKTNGNQRFNINKQEWRKNTTKAYIKNEYTHRPISANKLPNDLDTTKFLYGYRPNRDMWVPKAIIKKASQIPFVGLKN